MRIADIQHKCQIYLRAHCGLHILGQQLVSALPHCRIKVAPGCEVMDVLESKPSPEFIIACSRQLTGSTLTVDDDLDDS